MLQPAPAVNNRVARRPSGFKFLIVEISRHINNFKTVPPGVRSQFELSSHLDFFRIPQLYVVLRIFKRPSLRYHCPFLYDDADDTIGGYRG